MNANLNLKKRKFKNATPLVFPSGEFTVTNLQCCQYQSFHYESKLRLFPFQYFEENKQNRNSHLKNSNHSI